MLYQATRAVTAHPVLSIVDIDAAERDPTAHGYYRHCTKEQLQSVKSMAHIEIAFQPGVWRYIADTPGVFVSLGSADTQTALDGFGTRATQ